MAFYLMNTSKKGISAHQLHRMLGITYESAWFMCHRIRESMRKEPVNTLLEGIVETDETYIGGKEKAQQISLAFLSQSQQHKDYCDKDTGNHGQNRGGWVVSLSLYQFI